MATFDYNYTAIYDNIASDNPTLNGPRFIDGQLSDGKIDNVFQSGEPLDGTSESVVFVGTIEHDGVTLLVTQAGSVYFLYANIDDPEAFTPPGGIIVSEVDTSDYVACFLAGTRIATPDGECAVEDLAIGHIVHTATGETRPVHWIGRQDVASVFADPLKVYPIRIAAGALGDDLPVRDLFLSPDHALFLDGVLMQAGALVNGTTITRVERPEARFTYFHIELADHALILAEGAPVETFIDNVTRRRFDNYAEYEALYGTDTTVLPEIDLPRVKSARQLPVNIRDRLTKRAAAAAAEMVA